MNLIPEGTYQAVCSPVQVGGRLASIQWGPATPKSPFTAAVAYKIASGEYAGLVRTKFFYFGEVLDKGGRTGMDRSLEALRITGFRGDDIDAFSDQAPSNLVEITIEHQEYQGKTQDRIGFVQRPGGGSGQGLTLKEALPSRELKTISGRLKGRLSKVPEVKTETVDVNEIVAAARPAADEPSDAAMSDDNIPF